ncbi:acyl carrier protein [Ferrimonas sediminicola]|uniref:Acyl carrier protein n=1 Tax=Ferrimonas sediminicola TaxID=2569538 RepID=A0A4U1BE40_9GAMM|nr:phosphopantetheine-binding protein [Ferrimonas sediminicola]TKB49312.1 acyl carrier protein [Ferrimonas sediminicola]
MSMDSIDRLIFDALAQVAPEVASDQLDPEEDLREACDLDSMDFLILLTNLKRACGVSVPEQDYPQVMTLSGMRRYLARHLLS